MTPSTDWVAVIDDDESVRRALTRFLKAHDVHAESFESADAYVERTPARLPACLVLDVQLLKGMSSFALLDRMDLEGTRVPVIFITGQTELQAELLERYPELRALLRKPFDAGILLARVRHHLQRSGQPRSLRLRAS
ncbi:MAG: response regulator transcription factor [Gemmatimonadaceae bacterium]